MQFRWNAWNREHATQHGVSVVEAERVVERAAPPYPNYRGDEKWLVVGRGNGGRLLQVIYLVDEPQKTIYVIHARSLIDREKKRYRRGRR